MKDKILLVAAALFVLLAAYKVGYERATALCQVEATQTAQKVEEALARASDALAHISKRIATDDATDAATLKDIEDEVARDGTRCLVDVERLRSLDAIR